MKLEIRNPDDATQSARVFNRSTQTGQDGASVDLKPGAAAWIEVTSTEHLVAMPIGTADPQFGAAAAAPTLKEDGNTTEGAQLVDATDEQMADAFKAFSDAGTNMTARNGPEVPAFNAKLAEIGYNPINGTKRDELWKAYSATKPA